MNIKILAIIVLIAGGILASTAYVVNRQINLRVAAEITASAQKTRADLAEAEAGRIQAEFKAAQVRQDQLMGALQAARDKERQTLKVLEDRGRFQRLTNENPTLLEIRARKATAKLWADIEAESRDQ